MNFDPIRFLRIAELVAGASDDEAGLRTAVGRAYYACLLEAREKLGVQTRSGRVHEEVIGLLRRRDRRAGDQLDRLRELRGLADYHLTVANPLQRNWQSNWRLAHAYAQTVLMRLALLR